MSKTGIDNVISHHFKKVFSQNNIRTEKVWQDYWTVVDQIFQLIDSITIDIYNKEDEPSEDDIKSIVDKMKPSKASYGSLSIDLAKLGGMKISSLIHRCILACFRKNMIPNLFREEKMVLKLKKKGIIDMINDY